jgi:hypothetical protein
MVTGRMVVLNEWIFVISAPPHGLEGRVKVEVQNALPEDRPLARALAEIVRLWVTASRSTP